MDPGVSSVPQKYMDVITYEFAYDPVRLPLDQDPTQSLYDRKTLETIWETKSHAQNPMTKQWFNAKTAISQKELRQEMEDYIKLQKFSGGQGAKLDVIEDYTKILEEREMKQLVGILAKALSNRETTPNECLTIGKKINLLRLYCQFDYKNIETFRSLNGIKYLNRAIIQMTLLLRRDTTEQETKEIAWDVSKEIIRTVDVVGLKPLDIHNVESDSNQKFNEYVVLASYMRILGDIYMNNEGYAKIDSLMLRMFFKVFYEMSAQAEQIFEKKLSEDVVLVLGPYIATDMFSRTIARDISSENLYYTISILQTIWNRTSSMDHPHRPKVLVTAIIICIAREIDRSEETTGLSEGQLLEAKAERRYNSEALEKGLSLVKDIMMTEGRSADIILEGSLYIVDEIVRMFKHFSLEDEEANEDESNGIFEANEDESNGPLFCVKKGCKIFECIHSRIAQLGLNINSAILRRVQRPPPDDIEVLFKFLKFRSTPSI